MYNDEGGAGSARRTFPVVPESGQLPIRGDKITGDRYYCRDFAKREWDGMWTKVWHVGGREAELEEPGDFITHKFLRESVLMVRQEDGSIKAYYNSCMHRGNRLVTGQSGSLPNGFTCSYHGWRWGVDGTLEHAQDAEDFPQGNPCGKLKLKEIPCGTWGGFVWYSMNENAQPLMDYLYPIPQLFAGREPDKMVRVMWTTTRVNTNWKFSPDNFNESYHLPTVHPQMTQMIDEDYKNTVFEMYPNGHNRMIEQGQPSMRSHFPNEVEPIWELMLKEWGLNPDDFKGRARDGRLAIQQAKRRDGSARGYKHYETLLDDELTDYFHHTMFPNVTLTGTPDGIHFFRTEPDPVDPEWCTFDYWYLVRPTEGQTQAETILGVVPLKEAEHQFFVYGQGEDAGHRLGNFLDQDLAVAVTQQQGFHSRAYLDAYLSGQESRIRRFHEVLNDYIEGRRG